MRAIGSAIVGYAVMAVLVFVGLTIAWNLMGADKALEPGSFQASKPWIGVMMIVGLLAAVVGGWFCAWVAKESKGPLVLMVLVLVLGFIMAQPAIKARQEAPAVRDGDVAMFDAMNKAKQPAWTALLNPFIGAIGVGVGARVKQGKEPLPDAA